MTKKTSKDFMKQRRKTNAQFRSRRSRLKQKDLSVGLTPAEKGLMFILKHPYHEEEYLASLDL